MRHTKTILTVFVVTICVLVVGMIGYIVWRERARTGFSGCNLAHLNVAKTECLSAKMKLEYAQSDTNTPSDELDVLRERVAKAEVELKKWDEHVRKYGHLSGTATTEIK